MIDRIIENNPKCEIVLMTMTPDNKYTEGHLSYRKDLPAYYEMYREVAKKRGLMLIDHYPNWITLQNQKRELFDKYVPDTIHPTSEGCRVIVTPVILKALGVD